MSARGRRVGGDPAGRIARRVATFGASALAQWSGRSATHDGQATAFYAGITPGLELAPDPMFTARVRCAECHPPAVDSAPPSRRIAAMDRVCTSCHGIRFAGMLTRWDRGLAWRSRTVAEYVKRAAGDARLAASPAARADVRAAQRTLAAIEAANGLHNLRGADGLLRAAADSVAAAYAAARLPAPARPALGPSAASTSCLACHYGVEAARDSVFGRVFDHDVHVVQGGVRCTECHSAVGYFVAGTRSAGLAERSIDPRHGRTMLTAASCSACHHAATPPASCVACHGDDPRLGRALRLTLALRLTPPSAPAARAVAFQHMEHKSLECADCHRSNTAVATVAACNSCHAQHHEQAAQCAACHGASVHDAHTAKDHLACVSCHARATVALLTPDRSFCLTCHADHVDHKRGRECSTCHMQSTPAELRRRILGGQP
jgi:hypothetical protein